MYRCSPSMYFLGNLLKQCRFMSLPNLMVNRPIMPEFAMVRHSARNVARIVEPLDRWLSDEVARERSAVEMRTLAGTAAARGGIERAVDALLNSKRMQRAA